MALSIVTLNANGLRDQSTSSLAQFINVCKILCPICWIDINAKFDGLQNKIKRRKAHGHGECG